jgi:pseudouridylate synthase
MLGIMEHPRKLGELSAKFIRSSEEITEAVSANRPVVALESTLITHGLPWPTNLETAQACETAIRANGAIPATIAIWHGVPTVGLSESQLEELARSTIARKASRRDLGVCVGLKELAGTTVSATMALAHAVGIRLFATGGIGGAHRPPALDFDISADLIELAHTPVLVVCAGAKSILDLPRTLEILETLGVPVLGYRTDTFPTFYTAGGDLPLNTRIDSATQAAAVFEAHCQLGGGGVLLANPLPNDDAIPLVDFERARRMAEVDAERMGVFGARLTPYLLKRIAEILGPNVLLANQKLIVANAQLAAEIACSLTFLEQSV